MQPIDECYKKVKNDCFKFINLQETKMSSDGSIKVNNSLGTFELRGVNSNLRNFVLW